MKGIVNSTPGNKTDAKYKNSLNITTSKYHFNVQLKNANER